MRAITPIAISSITAAWFSEYFFSADPLFMLEGLEADLIELLPAALLVGPFFGFLAVLFMITLMRLFYNLRI